MTHRITPDTTRPLRIWPDQQGNPVDLPEHLAAPLRESVERIYQWAHCNGKALSFGLFVSDVEEVEELPRVCDDADDPPIYTGSVCPTCRKETP